MVSQHCDQNNSDFGLTASEQLNFISAIASLPDDNRLIQTYIRLQIPNNFNREPIISHLISDHHLAVNVTTAPTGNNARGDRWFTLELRGKVQQIRSAIDYLNEIHPGVLHNLHP
jgi:NIL domain